MSLFKRSFKLSKLQNDRWHVADLDERTMQVFANIKQAVDFIEKASQEIAEETNKEEQKKQEIKENEEN